MKTYLKSSSGSAAFPNAMRDAAERHFSPVALHSAMRSWAESDTKPAMSPRNRLAPTTVQIQATRQSFTRHESRLTRMWFCSSPTPTPPNPIEKTKATTVTAVPLPMAPKPPEKKSVQMNDAQKMAMATFGEKRVRLRSSAKW